MLREGAGFLEGRAGGVWRREEGGGRKGAHRGWDSAESKRWKERSGISRLGGIRRGVAGKEEEGGPRSNGGGNGQ